MLGAVGGRVGGNGIRSMGMGVMISVNRGVIRGNTVKTASKSSKTGLIWVI